MARVGIIFGLLLCGLTCAGMVGSPLKNPTQFIPMMLGIPVLFCGVVALNPHRRKYAMNVAAGVALMGTVAGATRALYCLYDMIGGDPVNRYALNLVLAMTVLCAVFLSICVTSLVMSRRRKLAVRSASSGPTINLRHPTKSDKPVADVNSRESA